MLPHPLLAVAAVVCCSQPFYHLLVEVTDWSYDAAQPPVAYVAQELLAAPELEDEGTSWSQVNGRSHRVLVKQNQDTQHAKSQAHVACLTRSNTQVVHLQPARPLAKAICCLCPVRWGVWTACLRQEGG